MTAAAAEAAVAPPTNATVREADKGRPPAARSAYAVEEAARRPVR